VHNQGAPIPAEEQRRVLAAYGPYERAEGGNASGAGLGLTIARAIVGMHEGTMGLTSSAAEGTTIWFNLPLAAAADEDAGAGPG
jgi:signal transduction histidine kinase